MSRAALPEYYDQFVLSFRSFEKLHTKNTVHKLTSDTYISIIISIISIISATLFDIVKFAK